MAPAAPAGAAAPAAGMGPGMAKDRRDWQSNPRSPMEHEALHGYYRIHELLPGGRYLVEHRLPHHELMQAVLEYDIEGLPGIPLEQEVAKLRVVSTNQKVLPRELEILDDMIQDGAYWRNVDEDSLEEQELTLDWWNPKLVGAEFE